MTGERIHRKLKGGGFNDHVYYRCANNHPDQNHPKVRWRAEDLEYAVTKDLQRLRLPPEYAGWFRKTLSAAFNNISETAARQQKILKKRKSELENMQEKLLNAYLNGIVEQHVFEAKSKALKAELSDLKKSVEATEQFDPTKGEGAICIFDLSQKAADIWGCSNSTQKRQLLEALSLNRSVSDVSLCVTKRKPFDILAEQTIFNKSRGDWTRTSDLLVPNQAL